MLIMWVHWQTGQSNMHKASKAKQVIFTKLVACTWLLVPCSQNKILSAKTQGINNNSSVCFWSFQQSATSESASLLTSSTRWQNPSVLSSNTMHHFAVSHYPLLNISHPTFNKPVCVFQVHLQGYGNVCVYFYVLRRNIDYKVSKLL